MDDKEESIETYLRRPDWTPGYPVRLCNGEQFHLEIPRFRSHAEYADGKFSRVTLTQFGDEWEDHFAAVQAVFEGTGTDYLTHLTWLLDRMLESRYIDERREYYRDIFYWDNEVGDNHEVFFDVWNLVRGVAPKKPIPDG
jgi:hypothetical protein